MAGKDGVGATVALPNLRRMLAGGKTWPSNRLTASRRTRRLRECRVAAAHTQRDLPRAPVTQGDSEYDGTAIETSVTGDFKITLIKKANAPPHLKDLVTPIIENANEVRLVSVQRGTCVGRRGCKHTGGQTPTRCG